MAITNAQQYQQLVNPPMKGNKRPGYRGDDAARSDAASGRDAGRAGPGGGTDDRGTAAQNANQRAQVRAAQVRDLEKFIDRPNILERGVNLYKKFSPIGLITRGITSVVDKFGTKKGVSTQGAPYGNMPGMLRGPDPTSVDDDGTGNGDGGQNIIPLMAQAPVTSGVGAVEDTDVITAAPRIAYRLMNEGGMADDRMPYEGGIMDLESARQMYGLGKLVKKVTRSVKKIAKSPIGKAALLGAAAFGIPGLGTAGGLGGGIFGRASFGGAAPGIFGFGGIGNAIAAGKAKFLANPMTKAFGKDAMMGDPAQFFSDKTLNKGLLDMIPGGKVGAGILGASALAGLMTPKEEEEQAELSPYLGEGLDIADIRSRPRFYQGQAYRLMSSGGDTEDAKEEPNLSNDPNYKGWVKVYEASPEAAEMNEKHSEYLQFYNRKAEGGSMKEPVAKKVMPLLDMDGQEMDFRAEGGFVPIGRMEKADDVPARLSKNEFVFTADAVRNAGEGDIDKGAEVMYNMMKNLESGGEVSEESQGLEGARKMFQTSQRLEEVL